MGPKLLVTWRLAVRDIRQRKGESALLLLALIAATTTLTLGLVLHGVTSSPYQRTREATAGPDVVVAYGGRPAARAALGLTHAAGVTSHSGPYPVAYATLHAHGRTVGVQVEGRGSGSAAVDQPDVTQGGWVRPGGVVLERAFADALGVGPGDRITLNGMPFVVDGIAVTAAVPAYPQVCFLLLCNDPAQAQYGVSDMGMAWTTEAAAQRLASAAAPLSYVLNLRLRDAASAGAFAAAHGTGALAGDAVAWEQISAVDGQLVLAEQQVLMPGSWLAGLLALASVTVLAGGRMAAQGRRVGLIKAGGGTPGVVAAVLLAENLILALTAAIAGLVAGWLVAPLLSNPGAGLAGAPGAPSLTAATVGLAAGTALGIALIATLIPAVRAARASTVAALADAARQPQRGAALIALSARMPVPLLFGLRLIARRPRRAVLGAATVVISVTGIVAVLTYHATLRAHPGGWSSGLTDPITARVSQVMLVLTVPVVILAAVNLICITWSTVLDARRPVALARGLGASARQIGAGLSVAQVIPSLPAALLGIPLGVGLFALVGNGAAPSFPSAAWLIAVVVATMTAVACLTAAPARIGARHQIADVLRQEA
jgi:putative ABC transport system permease protein